MRWTGIRRTGAAALATVVVAALTGLGSPGVAGAGAEESGHTMWVRTFVDRSRPTTPAVGAPTPERVLETAIYRPTGKGPFPLVLFSHGLDGHPEKFTALLGAWADAGYVVVAPAFPLTNSHVGAQVVGDLGEQPADISFVLDRVLELSERGGNRLSRSIDERRIGAGGLSLGGATTYALVYGECCRDRRVKAAMVLDGFQPGVVVDGHVPLLLAHADTDPTLRYELARDAYTNAAAPVWFVTLHGASHASQWEDDVTDYDAIAERVTVDFWDATLGGNARAFDRLERDATVAGLSSIEVKE